jgi:hypothetical protein
VSGKGKQDGFNFSDFLGGVGDVLNIAGGVGNLFGRRQQWNREDTAVQRRVADLEAAGLNKVLAAGSAASAAPMQIQGPKVGAMVDSMLKNQTKILQGQQLTNAKQIHNINAPSEALAGIQSEAFRMFGAMNPTRGNAPGVSVPRIMAENMALAQLNEQGNRQTALTLGIPYEMLMSGPGQTIMMNQYLEGLPKRQRAIFLKNAALLSVAGNAGQMAGSAVSNLTPGISRTTVVK